MCGRIRLGNGKGCVGTSNPAPACLLAPGVDRACIDLTVASEMVVLYIVGSENLRDAGLFSSTEILMLSRDFLLSFVSVP